MCPVVAGGGNANFNNFGGSGGSSGSSGSGTTGASDIETFFEELATGNFDSIPWETLSTVIGIIASVVLCLILFSFVMYFIRFIAESGMIQAAFDVSNGQQSSFKQAFASGRPFLIPMFGMRLLLSSPFIALIIIMMIGGAVVGIQGVNGGDQEALLATGFVILGCLVCLMVPLNLLTSILYPVAQRGMVLRGMGITDSIRHAWETFRNNLGEMLLLALIFTILGMVVGVISAIILVPILLGSGAPLFLALISNDMDFSAVNPSLYGLLGLGFIAMIIVGAAINAFGVSYRSATFTVAYIEFMDKAKLQSKTAE